MATLSRPQFLDSATADRGVSRPQFLRPREAATPRSFEPPRMEPRPVEPPPSPAQVEHQQLLAALQVAQSKEPAPPVPSAREPTPMNQELLERVQRAVDTLRLESERLAEQARSDVIELAFHVARRILEAEVKSSPEPLFNLVRSAIRKAGESRVIAVRMNPEDAAALGDARQRNNGLALADVTIVADSALSRGDVLVETDFGTVDGRLETRLGRIAEAVNEAAR